MALNSVKQRLAELLIYIHDSFGVDENDFLKIVLSCEDFANVVGTAIDSVIRTLSQLKKAGYI